MVGCQAWPKVLPLPWPAKDRRARPVLPSACSDWRITAWASGAGVLAQPANAAASKAMTGRRLDMATLLRMRGRADLHRARHFAIGESAGRGNGKPQGFSSY